MDTRPIGIFDSGLGGLTALGALKELLPYENFIYLGDTLRVPYGDKSESELLKCASDDIRFLLNHDVKAILIACGTVSSTLSPEHFSRIPVHTEGVVIPSVKKALDITNGKIGIIATAASIRAGVYRRMLLEKRPELEVYDVACPEFVPLVESGKTLADDPEVIRAAEKYLLPLKEKGIDTLILGCTHYPLLKEAILKILPEVCLVDVGKCAAEEIYKSIDKNENGGRCEFYVTKNAEGFKNNAQRFLGYKTENVKEVIL